MKVVILAGGYGTRLSEETHLNPKPMVEIGVMPILWHIMKIYSSYDINDFVICCGYKMNVIKEFFENNFQKLSDDLCYTTKQDLKNLESWHVRLVDTGQNTMTGGRLKRVEQHLENDTFCFTYGDTLNNVNVKKLIDFHKGKKTLATVTACIPPEKYGILKIKEDKVLEFKEKPANEKDFVNGGYFVLEPTIFDFIKNDSTIWEKEPMENLAKADQLSAYKHTDFYQPMDTMKDKNHLEELWNSGKAPWKVW